ncbi:hypothetical protein F0562_018975 [Nyssa sinensis]|uniref:Receptor-like serine/threonine-protein kinase n=1 Tax=Nyssa sinensis TaxID=561372 RepID=A0A5J4ZCD2_9ASTE|nr:hypothetical protein F0562_018975 [Nyssa sinensis]
MRLYLLPNYNTEILLDFWVVALKEKKRCCYMNTCLTKGWIFFLFDTTKQAQLDWRKRFTIIEGIARADRIPQGQLLRDGETIISADQIFVLGFFSPGNSTYRYVGIWYYRIPGQSVIWVANRENGISGKDGVFTIGNDGNLMVLDGTGNSVWSSTASVVTGNSTAILMDTGNLMLSRSDRVGDINEALWQSFNDPTDTYLPNMRVYLNVQRGENRVFTSWRSANDPSPGRYSMGVDPRGSPQIVIWEGLNRHWRSGHWNGLIFTGVPNMRAIYLYGFNLINEGNDNLYFTYTSSNSSTILRFQIRSDGNEEQLRWEEGANQWSVIQSQPANECEVYNKCGAFGECSVTDSPICSCIKGFVPKDRDQWNRGNWSGGCVRRTQLQCERNGSLIEGEGGEGDGFVHLEGVKLPDFLDSVGSEDLEECEEKCLKNCSCNAYAFVSGISCMIWSGDLVDVHHFAEGGNTLYIRLANSELGGKRKITTLVIVAIVVAGTFFLSVSIWLLWRFKAKLKDSCWKNNELPQFDARRNAEFSTDFSGSNDLSAEGQHGSGPELALFDFNSVAGATNNFETKLGRGGFGPVYKENETKGRGCGTSQPEGTKRANHVGQTLISAGQIFELGFFSPGNSGKQFVGIWYNNISVSKVWVENRENPLTVMGSASGLTIGSDGNLKLMDGKQNTVWSTNVSVQSNNSIAVLSDNGNFILKIASQDWFLGRALVILVTLFYQA